MKNLLFFLSLEQTSLFCLIHELLAIEGHILGKQEGNQTYYPAPIPFLHSTFFTLTLISPRAINEIYHWHHLKRGGKKMLEKMKEGEATGHKAGGII